MTADDFEALQRSAALVAKARKTISARRYTDRPGSRWHIESDGTATPRYVGMHAKALLFTTDDGRRYDVRVFTLDGGREIARGTWVGLDSALTNGQRLADSITAVEATRKALGR